MQESKEEKPGNVEVLLDGEMVAGYLVKPWTIRKAAALSPVFARIQATLKEQHLAFRDFFADGKVINMDQLFFLIMPFAPDIIQETLGISDAEVDKIGQSDMVKFISVIALQNIEYLKNLFALIQTITLRLKEGPTS